MRQIEQSLALLQAYIEKHNYTGYDPYDALKSPFFSLGPLKKAKKLRFLFQQFFKRFPVNLRSIIQVPQGENPVTLGLCIQAYAYEWKLYPKHRKELETKIELLINKLKTLIPPGFSGACWGYDFDWQARHAEIPAYQPTVVATGIISNGLFECWKITGNKDCRTLILSAANFVENDLNKTYKGDTFCYSYSPFDSQAVLNASMKAVRLLSQAYAIEKDEKFLRLAGPAAHYVANCQQTNGSFLYSKVGHWVDNYHTGYVLDCFEEYINNTGDNFFSSVLERGYSYYRSTFFTKDFLPKFYSNNLYPVDCTSAGQSLLTLCRMGDAEMAGKVAEAVINNMQAKEGFFYFRKYKTYTIKTPFMRWSNAWMFAGLAYVLHKNSN